MGQECWPRCRRLLFVALALALATIGSPAPRSPLLTGPVGASSLAAVARDAVAAMRADDWSRLRPLCAQIVVIGEYRRISRNEWSAAELAKLASRADGFGSNRKDPAQEPAMGSIAFHQVRRGQPMDAATRAAFRSLCGSVRFAVDNWSDRIRTGETIESEECSLFYGPATECRMISNEEWRIEYARVGGRWRVARLLRLEH